MARFLRVLLLLTFALAAGGGYWLWRHWPPLVEVGAVTRGPAVEAVYATGTVEPVRWAPVGPAVKARLLELYVDEGAAVQTGQVVARLDDTAARAQLVEAEARARFATDAAKRGRMLLRRGVAAQSELDRAESEERATAALVEVAQRRLEDYLIRSPIDGKVLRRDGEPGEVRDTADAVFWIGEPLPLRVTAEVDEEDIPRVRSGQRALLKADAFPDRALEGSVGQITPKGDPVQKTYRVRIALPDDTPLMIGMTIEANIIIAERPAVLAPARALRGGRVLVLDGGTVRERPVKTGVAGGELVEVRRGLEPGQAVALDPPPGLADGDRARRRDEPGNALLALFGR